MNKPTFWSVFPLPLFYCWLILVTTAALVVFTGINGSLFILLNEAASQWPNALWGNITLTGDTLFAVAVILALAARKPEVFAMGFLLLLLGTLVTQGAKSYFDLARPAGLLPHESINIIGPVLTKHSFPSGHSFTAFACWSLVALNMNKSWLPVFIALGLAGAFSRIAVGAHWPLDTLVGSALGILVAVISVYLVRRYAAINNAGIRYFTATIMTVATLWLPFYDDGFDTTVYLASITALVATGTAIRFFWWTTWKQFNSRHTKADEPCPDQQQGD